MSPRVKEIIQIIVQIYLYQVQKNPQKLRPLVADVTEDIAIEIKPKLQLQVNPEGQITVQWDLGG